MPKVTASAFNPVSSLYQVDFKTAESTDLKMIALEIKSLKKPASNFVGFASYSAASFGPKAFRLAWAPFLQSKGTYAKCFVLRHICFGEDLIFWN